MAGRRFHVVRAKRQGKEVLASQRPERLARQWARLDGGAKVVGDGVFRRAAERGVGGVPTAIRFGSVHLPLPVRGHAAGGRQPRDMLAVDLTPDAPHPARRIALQERPLVEGLPDAVDPSPTQHHVERLYVGNRGHAEPFL
jgi:hypothetical protein